MIFLDTNLLVATIQVAHPHHRESRALYMSLAAGEAAIATHTLAEIYTSITRVPPPIQVSPVAAVTVIETLLVKLKPVPLTPEDYLQTIRTTASSGHKGAIIYDALLLACARKIHAERIYTWNLKHFRALAPDLADRIMTP